MKYSQTSHSKNKLFIAMNNVSFSHHVRLGFFGIFLFVLALSLASVSAETSGLFTYQLIAGGAEVEITDYPTSESGAVDIPERIAGRAVTRIGDDAFRDCGQLTRIGFPDTLTRIGNSAFQGCAQLKTLTFPESLTDILSSAFANCTQLSSVFFKGNARW